MCLKTVSGTGNIGNTLHNCLVEPLAPPPLSQAAGRVEFSKSSMPGVLAAAALTPGILKHGRTVDINHLHVSLGHVHDEILHANTRSCDQTAVCPVHRWQAMMKHLKLTTVCQLTVGRTNRES